MATLKICERYLSKWAKQSQADTRTKSSEKAEEVKSDEGEAVAEQPFLIEMFTFGSPRVGNTNFCAWFDHMVMKIPKSKCWRITNHRDIVPHLPSEIMPSRHGRFKHLHTGEHVCLHECDENTLPGFNTLAEMILDHALEVI